MKKLFSIIDGFFFQKISASGFGLMRIFWGLGALYAIFLRWEDSTWYFSENGMYPSSLLAGPTRLADFSIFHVVTDERGVLIVSWILVVTLILTIIGWRPRLMILASLIMLLSFHNRNFLILNGGDRMLRIMGFMLLIAPQLHAFSLLRLQEQWKQWKKIQTLLKPLRMSIWPYRLLLWQYIVLYVTTGISKVQAPVWFDGKALAIIFHHQNYARFSKSTMDALTYLSPLGSPLTVLYELSWVVLLLPKKLLQIVPKKLRIINLKLAVLFGGVLLHAGIVLTMDVGTFSLLMPVGYLGLLLDEDFIAIRKLCNWRFRKKIAVLYDGHCWLCQRSMFGLSIFDHLQRLTAVDFRNEPLRKKIAPAVSTDDLDRAMHIKMPSGRYYNGFYAFRMLCWHIPLFWILAPFLYIPGVPPIGRWVYARIAENRNRCADGVCRHK